jgi:hypothetical protein
MFAPGKPFQLSPLCVDKASSLPLSGVPERCFTWVGSCLTCKHSILERLSRDKRSSLLRKFVTCSRKTFYNIGPRCYCYKTLFMFRRSRKGQFCIKLVFLKEKLSYFQKRTSLMQNRPLKSNV